MSACAILAAVVDDDVYNKLEDSDVVEDSPPEFIAGTRHPQRQRQGDVNCC